MLPAPHRNPVQRALSCAQATTDFAYLPFGGGRRKCIGEQFALFEAVVALAMLSHRFAFELDEDAPPVGMTTGATIHTTAGLNVKLRTRGVSDSVDYLSDDALPQNVPPGNAPAAEYSGHASGSAQAAARVAQGAPAAKTLVR